MPPTNLITRDQYHTNGIVVSILSYKYSTSNKEICALSRGCSVEDAFGYCGSIRRVWLSAAHVPHHLPDGDCAELTSGAFETDLKCINSSLYVFNLGVQAHFSAGLTLCICIQSSLESEPTISASCYTPSVVSRNHQIIQVLASALIYSAINVPCRDCTT